MGHKQSTSQPHRVVTFETRLAPKSPDVVVDHVESPISRSRSAWDTMPTKQKLPRRSKSLPVMSARRADINLDNETLEEVARLQAELKRTLAKKEVVSESSLGNFFEGKKFFFGSQELSGVPGQSRAITGSMPDHVFVSCTKGAKGVHDHGPNQDNYSYCKLDSFEIFTVLDGHGGGGHFVSFRATRTLLFFLARSVYFPSNMKAAICDAFQKTQADLVRSSIEFGFDIQISGAACVLVVRQDENVWTAHTGDSRIVIGSPRSRDVLFETADHKPANERARLEAAGAEVQIFQFDQGAVEISRVFVKGTDYPGLCMSRSLGDVSVKSCGVSAEPDISQYTVTPGNYIVLATDGVWEFIPSKLVTSSFSKKLETEGTQKCLNRIMTEAKKRWKTNEGAYCDDLTAMIIRL